MERDYVEKLITGAQNAVWNGYEEELRARKEVVDELMAALDHEEQLDPG